MGIFQSSRPGEMPFLDHLEELRWRILWSLLAVIACSIAGFVLVDRLGVMMLLIRPIEPFLHGEKLKYLSPTDPFFVTLKLAITTGLVLASPVVIYQVWAFLAPALLPSEKRVIVPSLYLGVVLFLGGVYMAYRFVLPVTLEFTMGFQTRFLEQNIVVGPYMAMVTRLLLAFGIVFELPVVILILSAMGLVTPEFLASKRRHAIAGITVVASVLTPGDVITVTLMMMVPLTLLYELSIVLSRLVARRRLAHAAAGA
ncbi:twin-arginine translocase subunit TatC [Longimicrobium sp.]|jgi:sec-independent protein translocase protein TatC|uniref:twin-arginine translocase subunit TatC n=1 Tax=Longimicrobium sp. TaxID=2029185 RepID=UPI002EDB5CCA